MSHPLPLATRFRSPLRDFLIRPASPLPLAVFRIGLAAVLIGQGWALAGAAPRLFGANGYVQASVARALVPVPAPSIGQLDSLLSHFGLCDSQCVRGVFTLYIAALFGLLAGWRSRLMAVAAWFTHMVLMTSGIAGVYGVDEIAHLSLFYAAWMPTGGAWSVDSLTRGQFGGRDSKAARLSLRLLQAHLCVIYLSSGLLKACGAQWWNGEAIWRATLQPALAQFDMTWIASVPWLAKVAGWMTLLIEVGYAFFIWPRRTRKPCALATIGLHLGIGIALGLASFSALMIVLTLSAFVIRGEPRPQPRASAGPAENESLEHESTPLPVPNPGIVSP